MRMRPICRTTSRNLDRCKAGHPVGSQFGTRAWYSSGKFQWNIGSGPPIFGNSDISRLTYNGLNAFAGEYFQRIDSPYNIFLKGNIGLGSIYTGHQNDEFGYSSAGHPGSTPTLCPTASKPASSDTPRSISATMSCAVPDTVFGPFVGYNYFTERWDTYGCVQIANPASDCVGNFAQPTTVLIGTRNSTWNSLRAQV